MRDILNELNYMDNVIHKLNRLSIRRKAEPNINHLARWELCYKGITGYTDENVTNLFANEYYRMMLDQKSSGAEQLEGKV